jgi:type IV pilus assembly protein PilB
VLKETSQEKLERFGKLLLEADIVNEAQWKVAVERSKVTGLPAEQVLVEMGVISQDESAQLMELYYGVPHVKLSEYLIDREALELLKEEICRADKMIPLSVEGEEITVAMADPHDIMAIDTIKKMTGKRVNVVYSSEGDITRAIEMYYATGLMLDSDISDAARKLRLSKEKDAKDMSEEAPIVQVVHDILIRAIQSRASDIHFEPTKNELMVRFRIDGILHVFLTIPIALHPAVISRLKIMGGMDITERRLPQDGRTEIRIKDRIIDMRISTLPLIYGEKLVIRLLDKRMAILSLDKLGFSMENLQRLQKLIAQGTAMLLVTGPTGSGKTSTCYAVCNRLRSTEKNIISAEDPVEYTIDLVNQVQVRSDIGLDFASVLRSVLRQDPDVVMVGEIRDLETANMAVHAALTGHTVISTLHTNDTPTAITRLIDMGIPNFLVASSISGIVAQRLVRTICHDCKMEYKPKIGEWEAVFGKEFPAPDIVYRGAGCKSCNRTGYFGRTAISEVLLMNNKLRSTAMHSPDSDSLMAAAKEEGIITLKDDALNKVALGMTTLEEILRINI